MSRSRFQVGGVLTGMDALYVERAAADVPLREALVAGELCHVLAPRQIGKSSLRVRTARWLESNGIRCVQIDLTSLGSQGTADQWYFGLVDEIAQSLELPDPQPFWTSSAGLAPVARFTAWCERSLVPALGDGRAVVFLDEIDFVRALERDGDDFLAAVRSLSEAPIVRSRVTFCLIGVAAPSTLIRDPDRTPFNVGRAIRLEDFSRSELEALAPGLAHAGLDPAPWLDAVHHWTGGHPYMTAKVCDALGREPAPDAEPRAHVDGVVRALFLERPFEDFNLKYAEDRFLVELPEAPILRKLSLYRQAFFEGRAPAADADPVETELVLAGMVRRTRGGDGTWLAVRNPIFGHVFDEDWIRARQTRRDFADALLRWLAASPEERPSTLMRGAALKGAWEWAAGRRDLTPDETRFLNDSAQAQEQEASERAGLRAKAFWWSVVAGALAAALAVVGWVAWRQAREDAAVAEDASRKAEEALLERGSLERQIVETQNKVTTLENNLQDALAEVQTEQQRREGLQRVNSELLATKAAFEQHSGKAQMAENVALQAMGSVRRSLEELEQDVKREREARITASQALDAAKKQIMTMSLETGRLEAEIRAIRANLDDANVRQEALAEGIDARDEALAAIDRLPESRPLSTWVVIGGADAPAADVKKLRADRQREAAEAWPEYRVKCADSRRDGTLVVECHGKPRVEASAARP